MEGPHVVQAVGQLDQKDPDVLRHGQDQLAEVLGLLGVVRLQLDAGQLGHAIDQPRDLAVRSASPDLLRGRRRILDGVVQQGGDDGGGVEPVVGQDARDLERMREIGVAGGAPLRPVGLHRKDVGAVQGILVRPRNRRRETRSTSSN